MWTALLFQARALEQPTDRVAVQAEDRVGHALRGMDVLALPAEEAAVESLRAFRIRRRQVDRAERPGYVAVSLSHPRSPFALMVGSPRNRLTIPEEAARGSVVREGREPDCRVRALLD